MSIDTLPILGLWYAVFLLSLTCHEAAHAFVAWRGGDPTAYEAGQVSLSPWPHIRREPWGTVLIPLITFLMYAGSGSAWMMGWASAPYDPSWERRHPRRAALMAAAGPAANLVLASAAFVALRGPSKQEEFGEDEIDEADVLEADGFMETEVAVA